MKRKYIFVLLFLSILFTGTAQATLYNNCIVIANGRSSEISIPGGVVHWVPIVHPRHLGYLSHLEINRCENMRVVVIGRGIHILDNISFIHFEQTFGYFMWRVFPDFYFNLSPKTRVCAFSLSLNIN